MCAYTLRLCLNVFQVLWLGMPDVHITWEPASSLPAEAIEEYEKGLVSTPLQQSGNHYGHETCTLVVARGTEGSHRVKKSRTERPLAQESGG